MNSRIRKLRRSLDLTQADFAEKIGSTANVLTHYETGRRNPSRSVINNICKTFNVNETWLRTGEGEMFTETPETTLDALAKEFNLTELELRIISKYLHLNENDRMVIQKWIQSIFEETSVAIKSEPSRPQTIEEAEPDNEDEYDPEARAQAEEYYRELILEKRARTSRASTYGNAG